MQWTEWVDIGTLKTLVFHASGTLFALGFYKLIAVVIEWGFKEGTLKTILKMIDSFVLIGLFIWLIYQAVVLLWNRRIKIGNGQAIFLLVA